MQFSKVICHNYGYDEKLGEEYLDKFVDFTVGLNTLTPKLQDNLKINIRSLAKVIIENLSGLPVQRLS